MYKKILLIAAIFAFLGLNVSAQVNPNNNYVQPHYKSNGTYVPGHNRTNPNGTNRDNYSTIPNTNHWNGKEGWVQPDNNPWLNTPNQIQPSLYIRCQFMIRHLRTIIILRFTRVLVADSIIITAMVIKPTFQKTRKGVGKIL